MGIIKVGDHNGPERLQSEDIKHVWPGALKAPETCTQWRARCPTAGSRFLYPYLNMCTITSVNHKTHSNNSRVLLYFLFGIAFNLIFVLLLECWWWWMIFTAGKSRYTPLSSIWPNLGTPMEFGQIWAHTSQISNFQYTSYMECIISACVVCSY